MPESPLISLAAESRLRQTKTGYNPAWPTCMTCGVRHPSDRPHLPTDECELRHGDGPGAQTIFVGYREQCQDRLRIIAGNDPKYARDCTVLERDQIMGGA